MSDSGDEPREDGDANREPSAPWERPARWERPAPWEAETETEAEDAAGAHEPRSRRRHRHAEAGDPGENPSAGSVPASELIAALTGTQPAITDADLAAGDAARAAHDRDASGDDGHRAEQSGDDGIPTGDDTDPADDGDADGAADSSDAAHGAAARGGDADAAADSSDAAHGAAVGGDIPTDDGSQQAADVPAGAAAAAAGGEVHSGRLDHHGWLLTGRSIIAAIAVFLLVAAGTEWVIKARADAALSNHQISALDTNDPNIVTPGVTTSDTALNPGGGSSDGSGSGDGGGAGGDADKTYHAENILVLGTDARHTKADAALGGKNDNPGGSDVIMVVHLAANRSHVTVISIPRDTYIKAPTCKKWDHITHQPTDETYTSPYSLWRINSTFAAGGPPCTVKAVQEMTGMRMDRVIVIDFSGFTKIVKALGGITVDACRPIVDRQLGTVLPEAGKQHIDGDQALDLVRARKVVGDRLSDLARIRRQQKVLSTILKQMTAAGVLLNPVKLDNVLQAFVNNVRTDNVSMDDLLDIARSLGNLNPQQVTFFTLPTYPDSNGVGLHPEPNSDLLWRALRHDEPLPGEVTNPPSPTTSTSPTTTSQQPSVDTSITTSTPPPVTKQITRTVTSTPSTPQTLSVSPGAVNVQVVNVAGHSLVATQGAKALRTVGFQIASGDLLRLNTTREGISVEYSPGHRAAALTLAAAVPGTRLVENDSLGSRVRIMLGTSFNATAFADDVQQVSTGQKIPERLSTEAEPVTSTITSTTVSTPDPVTSTILSTPEAPSTSSTPTTTTTPPSSVLPSSEITSINAGDAGCI